MTNEVLDSGVQRNLDLLAGDPFRGVAESVESADDAQERVACGLANAVVVVAQLSDELDRARLDEGQEVSLGGLEEAANGVGGNFLLDADGAVDVENLVEVDVNSFDVNFPIVLDLDSGGRR